MEHYARMTEKGVSVDAPKVTTQEQRKAILNAVTWKYDWIQQNKKRCFRFAEVIIARQKNGGTKNLQESRFVEDFMQELAKQMKKAIKSIPFTSFLLYGKMKRN